MKVLAVIPARGGSKSIKYKNLVPLNGRPLIYYTLNELLKTPEVDKVAVSTEDEKIAGVVHKLFGDKVLIIDRPAHLAEDETTSEDVLYHVTQIMGGYEYMLFAQCTSPLTEASDFTNLINKAKGCDSAGFYTENYDFFLELDFEKMIKPRLPRQVKTPRKNEAGNAWMFRINGFRQWKSRLFGDIEMCKIDKPKQLEIDEPEDLWLMEYLLKRKDDEI